MALLTAKIISLMEIKVPIHLVLIYPTEVLQKLILNGRELAPSTKFTKREKSACKGFSSVWMFWRVFLSVRLLIIQNWIETLFGCFDKWRKLWDKIE